MDKKKLTRLQQKHCSLYAKIGNIRERDLVGLAKKLGRRRSKGGKHPTYVSDHFPNARPITIPSHRTLKVATARSILDDLDGDIFRWQQYLDAQEAGESDEFDA